jgi:uncharacterized membrane protein
MNAVAQVLAVLQALTLIGVGALEAFFYRNQRFYGIFLIKPEDYQAVRLWVVNVGVENILVGLGCLLGVILLPVDETVGRTLILAVSTLHLVMGPTLAITEPKLWRGAVAEGGLGLLVIVTALAF